MPLCGTETAGRLPPLRDSDLPRTTMRAEPLLDIRTVSKTFPGLRALDDVSFTVSRGEIVALVGQNGSGKSTLVKILSGFHDPDPGSEIFWHASDGSVLAGSEVHEQLRFVHQDLGLVSMLNAIENLDLSRQLGGGAFSPVRTSAEAEFAEQTLAQMGAEIDVRAPVANLTSAERTMIAIARALEDWNTEDKILVLDEPTASLHGDEITRLMEAVRQLAATGAGIVFISHSLEQVTSLADRIVVLRDGKVVENCTANAVDHDTLATVIAGEEIAREGIREPSQLGAVKLSARGLEGPRVYGIDLEVRAGEILGVTGILGSGREQLAQLLFGAVPRDAGEIEVNGTAVEPDSPSAAIEAGMALVPADRSRQGAVMTMSVGENLTLTDLNSLAGRMWSVSRKQEREEVDNWIDTVDVRPRDPSRPLSMLSGGNQQKVVMAKWLRSLPDVLVLDEPTQGVDVGAKATLHQLIVKAADTGVAVLICSSDTEELVHLAGRVLVLRDGRAAGVLSQDQLTEARLIQESHGRGALTALRAGAVNQPEKESS